MGKSSRRWAAGLIGLAIVATASGMSFSRFYWGYWISPPSVVPWVHELQSAEALVFVECAPFIAARVKGVPASELHQLAAAYLESPKDYPGYQVLTALEATLIPMPQGIVVANDASKVCDGLFKSGVVVQGAPGYEYARFVRGFLVAGRTPSNDRVWIWSAIGGEVSNDHHAVYDLQFADSGALKRSHVYFEDIAGIEGTRWYVVSVVVFIAGALLFTATFGIVLSARFVARRLTRFCSRQRLAAQLSRCG